MRRGVAPLVVSSLIDSWRKCALTKRVSIAFEALLTRGINAFVETLRSEISQKLKNA
jgi:hypothetical protein